MILRKEKNKEEVRGLNAGYVRFKHEKKRREVGGIEEDEDKKRK